MSSKILTEPDSNRTDATNVDVDRAGHARSPGKFDTKISAVEKLPGSDDPSKSHEVIHFPWLTELRFFAALAVVICHIAQIRQWDGIGPHASAVMHNIGTNGVTVFFVLSGFLITHLLLSERTRTGTIDIRKFYFRRALRIWPLYYALIVVAFIVPSSLVVLKPATQIAALAELRFHDLVPKLTLFILMLPNVASLLFPPLLGAAQTWSIGVEEQFYLLWPFLVKKLGKYPLATLFAVIATKFTLVTLVGLSLSSQMLPENLKLLLQVVANFLNFFAIEAMAVGGIAACLLVRNKSLLTSFTGSAITRIALIMAVPYCFTIHAIQLHEVLLCDVVYAAMLVTLTTSNLRLPDAVANPLGYFGKISYSMYMLHPLVIMIVAKGFFCSQLRLSNGLVVAAVYGWCIGLTMIGAALSYEFYEKRFLVFKNKFAVVKSSS